jgi:hypothetical protein
MKRSGSSLQDRIFTVCFVVLTFFPYVCLPAGGNTNIPVSTIVALILALRFGFPQVPLSKIYFLLTAALIISLVTVLTIGLAPNLRGLVSFSFSLAPIFGFYLAAKHEPAVTLFCIRAMITLTCTFAILQKYLFFERGIIPFLDFYVAPGYADVISNAKVILLYMKRPFAQFPEPSFLAGTLALATVAMLFLSARLFNFNWIDRIALVLSIMTLYLSQSGVVFVAVGVILVFWIFAEKNSSIKLFAKICTPIAVVFVASDLANRRLIDSNWSWVDRLSAITNGLEYTFSNPLSFISGVGIGNTPLLYSSNKVDVGSEAFNAAPDIYSVFGRFLMSAGTIGLLLLILVLIVPTWQALNLEISKNISFAILTTWVTVATVVITYDSAAWVWGFGALFWGFADRRKSREVEAELENSSSSQLT